MSTALPSTSPAKDQNGSGFKKDVEPDVQISKSEEAITTSQVLGSESSMDDNSNVPQMALHKLFWFFFYNFGIFALGGPVAQIALIKDRLIIKDKWISLERFQRVFAVYQILPGPEAAELCMFFGCLSAGRLGGLVAGLGFCLPGFILMLLASYLYSLAGLTNIYFNASFRALQPIVAAMVSLKSSNVQLHVTLSDPKSNAQNCRALYCEP